MGFLNKALAVIAVNGAVNRKCGHCLILWRDGMNWDTERGRSVAHSTICLGRALPGWLSIPLPSPSFH